MEFNSDSNKIVEGTVKFQKLSKRWRYNDRQIYRWGIEYWENELNNSPGSGDKIETCMLELENGNHVSWFYNKYLDVL